MSNALTVNMGGINLTKDVLELIFRKLTPEQLLMLCTVCKVFKDVISRDSLFNSFDLREIFPNATFIDSEDENSRPCVDKADYVALKRMESEVEDGRGITIMTLFKTRRLLKFIESGVKIAGKQILYPLESILYSFHNDGWGEYPSGPHFEDEELPEEMTVAFTNGVFKGSRIKSTERRMKIVEDLKCEVPGILAALEFAIAKCRMTPQGAPAQLFSNGHPTEILCVDERKINQKIKKKISHLGYSAREGLMPNELCYDLIASFEIEPYDLLGAAGLRKLKVIRKFKNDIKESHE